MRWHTAHCALAACVVLGALPALGQVPQIKPPSEAPVNPPASELQQRMPSADNRAPQLTEADVSAFVDGMLPTAMAIGDIAGAVVVVVKDDRVLMARGYGFADMEKRSAVSPETTMFRPGSISKLFTWTAVMQLVEAGKLDLDADINQYLDFKIPAYGGAPIKLRHLMTHTPGFEERIKDLLLFDPSKLKSLEGVLKEGIPSRIYPPGKIPAYSNYGAALAGYIVQRVSGVPFQDYIEQRIFRPLGMNYSTFRQPTEPRLRAHVSQGYLEASGKVVPFELSPDVPAGALSASGVDMGRFMLAHLNEGRGILQPHTVQRMHSVANRPAPFIDAMCYGFYEQNRNGLRAIAHGGDLIAFHSDLILLPSERVGLYMSFNSVGRNHATYNLRTALFEAFMDRYFPRRTPQPAPAVARPGEQTAAVLGEYELSRRAARNLFSFLYLFGQTRVSSPSKGKLEVEGLNGLNEQPKKFQEVGPWLWREVAGEARLAAVRSVKGSIEYLAPDGYGPIFVFQPVPAYRDKRWLVPALGLAAAILVIAVISWSIAAVRRWRRPHTLQPRARQSQRVRTISKLSGIACAVFLALAVCVVMLSSGETFWIFSSDATLFLRLVQLSALLAVLAGLGASIAAIASWRASSERFRSSLAATSIAVACLICAYVVLVFHFLSLHLQY